MRNPGKRPTKGNTPADILRERQATLDFLRTRGTAQVPLPPRDVFAQSGPRGVFLTWKLPDPTRAFDICGWRIYKTDENTLYHELRDRGARQMFVEASAGSPSVIINFFVSSLNVLGKESRKVQVQAAPSNESGAPAMPGTPPGYNLENAGGANLNSRLGRFNNF